ncbi:hypothetical protein CFP56_042738, partial [Quercus suber]
MGQIPNQNHLSKFNPSKSRPILVLIHRNGGTGRVLVISNKINHAMIGISLARCLCKWCRLGLHEWWRFAMQDWLGMWGQKYMECRIQAEECSLIENYNNDDMVIRDPVALKGT